MSDFRALAAASSTLRTLLRDRMDPPAGIAADALSVSIGTPRAEGAGTGWPINEAPRVNLFLYQVTENQFLKNQDARASSGAYGSPPLALNLHYLLTAYGATGEDAGSLDESTAQQLLGSAMLVLHEFPVLGPSLATVREPAGMPVLHPALLDATSGLRIALDPLGTEELTRLWTSLTIALRTSAAYSVSVVELETRTPRSYPQLVREPPLAGPRILLGTLSTPRVSTLSVRRPGDPAGSLRTAPYARIGDTLVLDGAGFGTAELTVFLGQLAVRVRPESERRLQLVIPDDALVLEGRPIPAAARLQPGVLSVGVSIAVSGAPGKLLRSNTAALMLTPKLTSITLSTPDTLVLEGTRLRADGLAGETLIGRMLIPDTDYVTGAGPDTGAVITVALGDHFPRAGVSAYLTATLGAFVMPGNPPAFTLSLGGSTAEIELPGRPGTWTELASMLQGALRASSLPGSAGARVGFGGSRMVVLLSGAGAPLILTGTDAQGLGLDTGLMREAYRSGGIDPAADPLTGQLAVSITRNTTTGIATWVGGGEADAAGLAPILAAALHDSRPVFGTLEVVALGDQLLVFDTGADVSLSFGPVPAGAADTDPAGDPDTVARLGLRVAYPVRVRVNGAEAIGSTETVVLPS